MPNSLPRRTFLAATAATVVATLHAIAAADVSAIIDCHTHFYDPTRPGGVPWPGMDDKVLYRTVLPKHFRAVAEPQGVTGTVVVEASPLVEDNQWLLDLAKDEPWILGIVGRLAPGSDPFAMHLARFARNPLFRGIRVNHVDLKRGLENERFISDLHRLVDADLQLDLNGGPDLPTDVARVADQVKSLRIIINHCANLKIDGEAPPADWLAGMKAAAGHENVWCKVSALVEGAGRGGQPAPKEVDFYRPILDALWSIFGEDRLIYGSNWPVSERFGSYETVFKIAATYVRGRGDAAAEKFFAENAVAAYKCRKTNM